MLPEGSFVPNDVMLSSSDAQVIMLTGPNMAGKSTYLRQVALIALMAQTGSFVPAREARIGVVDRMFSRVGALDDIAAGHSTFMVEMLETAAMLHQATPRSLLIFDEIGRGTSTYDGMAIARAVAEFVHNRPDAKARTLFATHYHELTALADTLPRVRNFNVAVAEEGGGVVFLHRILPGGADRSYGVHVAQLAGLPRAVVARAQELLEELEAKRDARPRRTEALPQLPLFARDDDALRRELAAAGRELDDAAGGDPAAVRAVAAGDQGNGAGLVGYFKALLIGAVIALAVLVGALVLVSMSGATTMDGASTATPVACDGEPSSTAWRRDCRDGHCGADTGAGR